MASSNAFRNLELAPHMLLEHDDNRPHAVWLPQSQGDAYVDWWRILPGSQSGIPIAGMSVFVAGIHTVRETKRTSWWKRFGRRQAAESRVTMAIPNGSEGEIVGKTRYDAVLILADDQMPLDVDVLHHHCPFGERFEQLGPRLWLVVSVKISPAGTFYDPKNLPVVEEAAEKIRDAVQPAIMARQQPPAERDAAWPAPREVTAAPTIGVVSINPSSHHASQNDSLPINRPADVQVSTDRSVRVFVSSTFRDMKAERNYLMSSVFPMLRKLCETRGLIWGAVDFRWGITEKEQDEKQVLPICLREVERCAYFIGLLGERYGWIPASDDIPQEVVATRSWPEEYRNCSLMEMEMAHGALRDAPSARHAFFYFRDPEYVNRLTEGANASDFHAESADAKESVDRLKQQIRDARNRGACHLRVDPFRTVEELGAWVLDDFSKLLDRLFPEDNQAAVVERDIDVHLAQAQSHANVYVARQEDFDTLDAHVASREPPLAMLGESGAGKSALLAKYFLRYRARHPRDFALVHFIGRTPDSADEVAMMRRIMLELKHHFQLPDEVPFLPDQIRDGFRNWLKKSAGCGPVLLLLDGLNQLNDHDRTLDLDWLPSNLPATCRVILSTLPGRPLDAIRRRKWPETTVRPLNPSQRRQLVHDYLQEDARHLGEALIEQITSSDQTGNPLFLRSMLDELRRSADHDALPAQIRNYLQAANPQQLFVRLLLDWQKHFGEKIVRDALSLVWTARRGLAEVELLDLLGGSQIAWIRAAWLKFYFAVETIFVQRGGLLGFSYHYVREAVHELFLQSTDDRQNAHRRLAVYFSDRHRQYLSDRTSDELTWQYFQIEDWSSLKDLLTDRHVFLRLRKTERGKAELQRLWLTLAKYFDPCEAYAQAAHAWVRSAANFRQLAMILTELADFHYDRAEFNAAEPLMRRALDICENAYSKNHVNTAAAIDNLAQLLHSTNRLKEAEPLMRRALAIYQQSFGAEHPHVAIHLNNLAQLLWSTNRLTEAEPLMRRALAINEQSYGTEHPAVALHLGNLAAFLLATNRLVEAEPLMGRALAIDEQSYGAEHPRVAIDLKNLAQLFWSTNRLTEAEPLIRRALAIDEHSYGAEHPRVAIDLNNLAQLFWSTNRLTEAEPLIRRALAIDEHSYGAEHTDVARDLNSLAVLLQTANRLAEAEPLIRRALAIDEQSYGAEHPNVAIRLSNLAQLLWSTNRLTEAEPLMRRALAIDEQSYGAEHPDVAIRLNNLAHLLRSTNRLSEAEPLMRRSVAIFAVISRQTGHSHAHLHAAVWSYQQLLVAMNVPGDEMVRRLAEVTR